MTIGLIVAFLFFVGALAGWGLEFVFRNLVSHKGPKGKYFINPGFCRGPYLPIYGVGVAVMFLVSYFVTPDNGVAPTWAIVLGIGVCMSCIEFFGGWFLHKFMNMRLWDYSEQPGNICGYICPLFSCIWLAIGGIYYIFLHPIMIDSLIWLSQNLAFSFFVGLFFGFFIIDFALSTQDAMIIKEFGDDHDIVVRYEELKELVQQKRLQNQQKSTFFHQTSETANDLRKSLMEHIDSFDKKIRK